MLATIIASCFDDHSYSPTLVFHASMALSLLAYSGDTKKNSPIAIHLTHFTYDVLLPSYFPPDISARPPQNGHGFKLAILITFFPIRFW